MDGREKVYEHLEVEANQRDSCATTSQQLSSFHRAVSDSDGCDGSVVFYDTTCVMNGFFGSYHTLPTTAPYKLKYGLG